jgi:hypothetical protein
MGFLPSLAKVSQFVASGKDFFAALKEAGHLLQN